jgi:hypothetical protein
MKMRSLIASATMILATFTSMGADFKAPFHETVTFTNVSTVVLPAVTNARAWAVNSTFTNGEYIAAFSNNATRYLLCTVTGNSTNVTPDFLSLTNWIDKDITWRPVVLERQAYVICNDTTNEVAFLSFGKTAVGHKGYRLAPGAVLSSENVNAQFWAGEISAITTSTAAMVSLSIMQR